MEQSSWHDPSRPEPEDCRRRGKRKHRTPYAEIPDHPDAEALPRQNERVRAGLKFPGKPASVLRFLDIRNAQTRWLALSNLIAGAEADLAQAQAFRALAPGEEPPSYDSVAVNDLYFIHDRKMNLLNNAAWALQILEDLVQPPWHERIGGDLVDRTLPYWERREIRREKVFEG